MIIMKLSDVSNGPDWIVWVIVILFAVSSIYLLTGHGSWLIAGYNTTSKEEKGKYDGKKLCRVTGGGLAVVTILLVVMELLEDKLPADFAWIAAGVIFLDAIMIIVLGNTLCKKK